MKCFYIFILIAVCQGLDTKRKALPVPNFKRLTAIDPHGFIAEWDVVKSVDDQDPVIGYKLKIWEEAVVKNYRYEMKDGVNMLVAEDKPPSVIPFDLLSLNKISERKPIEIVVPGGDKTKTQFDDLTFNVEYEIRVQAFTNKADGPLSDPMKIKLIKNNNTDIYAVS